MRKITGLAVIIAPWYFTFQTASPSFEHLAAIFICAALGLAIASSS